jgi:sugar O-acyltransferase (sialic acid O-acetyltransferase NeuD family)
VSHAERVVIIGAGDHGRGALEIFREARRRDGGWDVLGFVDDSPARRGTAVGGAPVLGDLSWICERHRPGIGYVIAIADPHTKQVIAERLRPWALTFVSVVHPAAFVGSGVQLAPGALINAGATIAYDTVIGEHTTVNLNATIGHDCVLGRFSTVAPGANIAGKVYLEEGCDVGLNATVGKGLRIGEWSSIGPGTVVIKSVPPRQQVFGNPARVVAAVTRAGAAAAHVPQPQVAHP